MSIVTNIMITCLLSGDEEEKLVLDYLNSKELCFRAIDGDAVGGTKSLEGDIFIGAFNYLDTGLLVELVKGLDKEVDEMTFEDTQIIIKGQEDETWHTHLANELNEDCFR